ncbi:MAG: hypothetical protein HKP27_01670, partial [Myxococcales bacterium]|nr:hypothetical protein [Myxococcales bacterium]
MRAFFAAAVPDSARREIAAQVEGIRSAARGRVGTHGWVPAANYHVTLRFLGSVARENLAALNDAAERALAERSAFVVETGAPLWLRAHRGRQVLALSVHPEGPLQQLANALAEGPAQPSVEGRTRASLRPSGGTR